MHYNTIFQQLFNFLPRHRFEKAVENSGEDRYCKHFTAWKQFLTILYAQITGKDSLREIATGLIANQSRLYHLGMEVVPKSTLSEAMNRRSYNAPASIVLASFIFMIKQYRLKTLKCKLIIL